MPSSDHSPHTHRLTIRKKLYRSRPSREYLVPKHYVVYGEGTTIGDWQGTVRLGLMGWSGPTKKRHARVLKRCAKKAIERHDAEHKRKALLERRQVAAETPLKKINRVLAAIEPGDVEVWGHELIKTGGPDG